MGGAVTAFEAVSEHFSLFQANQASSLVSLGLLLGGMAGEMVARGNSAPYAGGDIETFEPMAKNFLLHFPQDGFALFAKPSTDMEVQHNARTLQAFREWLLQATVEFIRANEASFLALKDSLVVRGDLDSGELVGLLADVVAHGPFERFEWPPSTPAMPFSRSRG